MHTSYFLFVMVITMFCYAVIKGRPIKSRQSTSEFCPEKVGAEGVPGTVCVCVNSGEGGALGRQAGKGASLLPQ